MVEGRLNENRQAIMDIRQMILHQNIIVFHPNIVGGILLIYSKACIQKMP